MNLLKIFYNKIVQPYRILHYNKLKGRKISLPFNVRIDKHSSIQCVVRGSVSVGENVYLRSNTKGYHAGMPFPTTILVDEPGAKVVIGNNCRLNGVYLHAQKSVFIGENCVIASGVNILDSNGHILNSSNRTIGRDEPKEIEIGNNVWIGLNSTILKGTTIGDNSVVAAGSIVKGVFPPNSLIQGNPACVVSVINVS